MSKNRRKRICSKHGVDLVLTVTKYGDRFDCPVDQCDVRCWGGRTSTPADGKTRSSRMTAHEAFDPIWLHRHLTRREAYKRLAAFLGIPVGDCHMGMMSRDQCEKVVEFSRQFFRTVYKKGSQK